MKLRKLSKVNNGIYKVYWKKSQGGGSSFAAIGTTVDGYKWIAATHWTSPSVITETQASYIRKIELLHKQPAPEEYNK